LRRVLAQLIRVVIGELAVDERQEGGRVFQFAQIKARLQLVVAIGQRYVVRELIGFDRAPLWQVSSRTDGKQCDSTGEVCAGEVQRKIGQSLVNIVGGRNLSLASCGTAAEEHEQLRIVESELVVDARADRPVPAATDLFRLRRLITGKTVRAGELVNARRILPEITPPYTMPVTQVGVTADSIFILPVVARNQALHGGHLHAGPTDYQWRGGKGAHSRIADRQTESGEIGVILYRRIIREGGLQRRNARRCWRKRRRGKTSQRRIAAEI